MPHKIFELDEILRLIAGELVNADNNGTALAFACSRRLSSDPVLDTMWEEGQGDFTTLLKTFPAPAWAINDGKFDFLRQPLKEEWDRFYAYVKRTRKLSFNSCSGVLPSQSALWLLNAHFSGRCMFPNLLDLELGWLDKDETRHLPHIFPLVLSPALSNITLTLENTSHTKMALSSLALSYNSLTFIYSVENDSGLVQEFSTLLLKCTPHRLLRFIVDAPVTWAAFLHASQLPCLQYFGAEGVQVDQPDPPLPATMFHSLKFLAIWGLSANSIWLQTFGRICSTNLELLLLELKDPCDARMAVHLKALENIRHCCHRTLTDLFIMCKDQFSGLEVDRRLVQILLPFTQLTLLHISFTCGQGQCSHKLSDEDLERLVKAMPNLSELVLGGRILCPIPANNSIKSLVAIAKHCKHLEELTIHTNVEAIISGPPPEEYPIPRDQNSVRCPLHSITFGPCSIPNGEQGVRMFVSVLEGLFPNLLMVGASPTTSQWRLVRAKIFAAAGSVTSDPLDVADALVTSV